MFLNIVVVDAAPYQGSEDSSRIDAPDIMGFYEITKDTETEVDIEMLRLNECVEKRMKHL